MASMVESRASDGSELVLAVRESWGWSRPELATHLGVSREAVRLWETTGRVSDRHRGELERLRAQAPAPIDLRTLRQQLGWSQTKLAKRLGVDQSRVAQWERGERMPAWAQDKARKLRAKLVPAEPRVPCSPLQAARESIGMTLLELADWLGVSVSTVSRWERGIRTMPTEYALAVKALTPEDNKDRPTPEWMKTKREERGLTRHQFADQLRVHVARVHEWESGERPIPPRLYGRIRRALEPQARFHRRDSEVLKLVRSNPAGLTMRQVLERFPQHDHRAVLGSLRRHIEHKRLFRAKDIITSNEGRPLSGWRFYPQPAEDITVVQRMTGDWLRRQLDETGWSPSALAREVGVTRGGIKDWVRNGDALIPPARQAQVAEALLKPAPAKLIPRLPDSAMPDLKERRLAVGLTQRELSRRCGVPVTSIAAYEHGRRVSPERAATLSAALAAGPGGRRRAGVVSPRVGGRAPQTYESKREQTGARIELDAAAGFEPVTVEELRAGRARTRLTRRQFGERLGVSRSRIRNWEEGTSPVPPAVWAPIRALVEQAAVTEPALTGEELRDLRERVGWTRRELSERLDDVSEARIHGWEHGSAVPPPLWAPVRGVLQAALAVDVAAGFRASDRRERTRGPRARPPVPPDAVTAEELRARRERTGLTRRQFAERLGVPIARIKSWEVDDSTVPRELWAPIRALAERAAVTEPPLTGEELRDLRERVGWTRRQLSEHLDDVSAARLVGWELNGNAIPSALWAPVRAVLREALDHAQDRRELDAAAGVVPLSAEELRAGRERTRLTQLQFAERLDDVSANRLAGWEYGNAIPPAFWTPIRSLIEQAMVSEPPLTGEELRAGRDRLGWSRRQLSEHLDDVGEARIERWELQRSAIPASLWAPVRAALQRPLDHGGLEPLSAGRRPRR